MTTKINSFRPKGTRNFIRVGDRVKFQERPGHKIQEATVTDINLNTVSGEVESVGITICRLSTDGKAQRDGSKMRVVRPEKLTRMSQAKVQRAFS